jgi:hypothetical protein
MNGVATANHPQNASARLAKPVPTGPAPPAPAAAPPVPPIHTQSIPASRGLVASHSHPPTVNGTHGQNAKAKKKNDTPVDPAAMYESLKNRIAALEEEEVIEEEEEKRFGEYPCDPPLAPST